MKFYSIGYGNRKHGVFLDLLHQAGVRTVVDIRIEPVGRIEPYTRRESSEKGIQRFLATRGIGYLWLGELGNPFRKDKDWRTRYPPILAAAWENARPKLLGVEPPACIMCGCLRLNTCHREYVANLLEFEGHEVVHL